MPGFVPLWVYWVACVLAVAMGVFSLMLCFECFLLSRMRRRQRLIDGVRPPEESIRPGVQVPFLTHEIVKILP